MERMEYRIIRFVLIAIALIGIVFALIGLGVIDDSPAKPFSVGNLRNSLPTQVAQHSWAQDTQPPTAEGQL